MVQNTVFVQGVALLTVSAFFHAAWNALAKRHKDTDFGLFVILVVALFATAATQIATEAPRLESGPMVWWAVAAGVCEGAYFLTLARSLESMPYGVVYTVIRGAAMVFVWAVSVLVLGEVLTVKAVLGALLVGVGIGITTIHSPSQFKLADWKHLKWGVICAGFVAGYHHSYGQSLARGANPTSLFSLALVVSIIIYWLAKFRTNRVKGRFWDLTPRNQMFLVVGGLACAASFLFFLSGLHQAGPSIGITIRNTSVVFAQVLALVIGEKVSLRQWVGALIVVAGAALVAGV